MPYIKIELHGKLGQGKTVQVDGDYDGEYFNQYKWYVNPGGYVYRRRFAGEGGGYVYLHQEVSRPPSHLWATFKDGDKLNCRSCNMIWRTPKESAELRKPRKTNDIQL